jgi:TonB-linked SusC/RagA family outer membrane protein
MGLVPARLFREGRGRWAALAVLVSVLTLLSIPLEAQQVVSGTVVNARTQRPIGNTQVRVEGTDLGGVTNSDGEFQIVGVPTGQITLVVVRIGFRPLIRVVASGTTGNTLSITESAVSLDEIVVTGTAGQQTARSIGNAVAQVQMTDLLELAPAPDISKMLSGQVAGVRFMSTGGEVGAGAISRIRGVSSMSLAATPLIYVDGVRVNNLDNELGAFAGTGFDGAQQPSRINDFNPEDIESIEIIKGPAAATLYGTEAANGVIQIITKKGRQGRPTVNMWVRQGASSMPDPENLFPEVYYRAADGSVQSFNVLREDRIRNGNVWFHTGHAQTYGASVDGGSEQMTYYMSMDWARDEGPVPYNWRNKLTGRANVGYRPNDAFDVNLSLGMVRSSAQSSSAQQPFTTAIIWSCPAPGCEEGSGAPNAIDGPFRGYIAYLPEVYEDEIEGFQHVDRTTVSVQANHRITPWLTHRVTVGGDFGNNRNSELYRATGNLGNALAQGSKTIVNSRVTFASADYQASATLRPTSNLTFTPSAGFQFFRKQQELTFAQGQTFPVSALETVSSGATRIAEEDFIENRTVGVFFQGQASWKDRLFLTGAVRGDDNSAFGENFKFVAYPKVQGSWVVTDEPFAQGSSLLSTLKLRAAWGRSGQQPDVFAALRTYEPTVGVDGASTLTPDNVGNLDLEPEVGEELEVGFDASLFDDRVALGFTHFRQRTTNAILRVPALPSLGFPGTRFENIGEVKNNGIELTFQGTVTRSDNFGLDLGFTFSTTKNQITSLGGQPPLVHNAAFGQMHVEGLPLASIFMKRVVSADIDDSGALPVAANVLCEGGTIIEGTNVSRGGGAPVPCAEAPAVYWGQPVPEWEGSASTTVTLFRHFELYGLVDFLGGRTLIDGSVAGSHRFFLHSRAAVARDDPILLGYESLGGEGIWQTGTINGGFAKLRTISATVRFPQSWAERLRASRMSLNLAAENLATLWVGESNTFGHDIIDPEVAQQTGGATEGLSAFNQEGWPMMRSFYATVRVTF